MAAAVRWVVAALGAGTVVVVLASAVRTVVVPGAAPARLARAAFLLVGAMLRAAARVAGRPRWLAAQAPVGLFAQLAAWVVLVATGFAAVLWAVDTSATAGPSVSRAVLQSGSSLTTLGVERFETTAGELVGFVEAGVGLVLLALTVTYLPTIYAAFSRREALVTKLAVRAGVPTTAIGLLERSATLGRTERLEEVWSNWQDWFVDIAESHVSFPQLSFFASARSGTSWVTAAGAVLDAATLSGVALHGPFDSRARLCLDSGIDALHEIGTFLAIPRELAEPVSVERAVFDAGLAALRSAGLPVCDDADGAWRGFAAERARYDAVLLTLAGLASAVPSPWLPASAFRRHRPPLLRPRARAVVATRPPGSAEEDDRSSQRAAP